MNRFAWLKASGLAAVMVAALSIGSAISASAAPSAAAQGKVKVFLSNSFVGNDWRVEMENVATAAAKKAPFADRFDFQIVNVDNTPDAQTASLDNMVQQGAKVILVDASSPTALNAAIQRACDAGVIVISFDQIVTSDCAYKIDSDFGKASQWGGLWLAKKMGGKGNVVFDRGLPGAPISQVLTDGGKSSFAQYPDIKIVCEFDGQYAEGPTEQGITNCLSANPQVDAIYTQGYCTSAVRALKAAGRPMVPMYCQAYNGNYLALLTEPGISGIVTVNPPGLSALAMQTALDLLDGKTAQKQIRIDPPVYVTDTSIDIGVPTKLIKIGDTAFPDLPPGLTFPALPPGLNFTISTDEAQGKTSGQATAAATGAATAAPTMAATASAATMAPTQVSAAPQAKVKVFLSNSFMGNDWRVQMINTAQAVSKKEPFASRFDFQIVNVDNSPEAQTASIDNMVAQGAKAILIDASSGTALNAAIQRACDAGVIVISFDQVVTADCAYKIQSNIVKFSNLQALYIAKAIKGKGNIILDRGLPGAPISKTMTDGAKAVFAQYPDIHIVCEFDGMYAEGPNEQGVANCLAANPQVDAVFGPSYCAATIRALKAANRPMVPMSCANFNGSFLALATTPGASGVVLVNSPGLSALAMQTALDIMDGKAPASKDMTLDTPIYGTDTTLDIGVTIHKIEVGVVAFPDLPPGLSFPLLPDGLPFTITNDEAQGKAPGQTPAAAPTTAATAAATMAPTQAS